MQATRRSRLLASLVAGAGLLTAAAAPAQARQTAAPPAAPLAAVVAAVPAANPADVASVDAIVAALYDVISGPAGKVRDWDRLRSLFLPQGRMMAVGNRPDGSSPTAVMSVDDYIGRVTKPFADAGFYESELARSTETFGPIVHVFSTYESRHAPADAAPFQRGINSIQLAYDGRRWAIVNLLWRAESDKQPLPEKYLKRRP